MSYIDYANVDLNKDVPDYAFVAIGDTSDTQYNQNLKEELMFKREYGKHNNIFVETVMNGGYDNKPLDIQHEAARTDNFTIYGYFEPNTYFINDKGFVDNVGKVHKASEGQFPTIYQVVKLTDEGKKLITSEKYLTTSSYFSYEDDNGDVDHNHGNENRIIKYVTKIYPKTVSFLLKNKEPKIKISPNDKYVVCSKSQEKQFFGENNNLILDNKDLFFNKSIINNMSVNNIDLNEDENKVANPLEQPTLLNEEQPKMCEMVQGLMSKIDALINVLQQEKAQVINNEQDPAEKEHLKGHIKDEDFTDEEILRRHHGKFWEDEENTNKIRSIVNQCIDERLKAFNNDNNEDKKNCEQKPEPAVVEEKKDNNNKQINQIGFLALF